MQPSCLIVGSGPAALIAADLLSRQGVRVTIWERRAAAGWKLLVAGSSGLNVTYNCAFEEFSQNYRSGGRELLPFLERFSPQDWLDYLEDLGESTYVGTSKRYFLKNFQSAQLLEKWLARLESQGVTFQYQQEFSYFEKKADGLTVVASSGEKLKTDSLLLALGSPSWEKDLPQWPEKFRALGIQVPTFQSANAGWELQASEEFFTQAGQAIKGLILHTKLGSKQGELMITKYGLEGTPVYSIGCAGEAWMDLRPELTEEKLRARFGDGKMDWDAVVQKAKLSSGALAMLKEFAPPESWTSPASAAATIKHLSFSLQRPRPLSECISASGGIAWSELDQDLQLRKFPKVFCAGEMIDWDAPTGGFLLQACVSTGYSAAEGILHALGFRQE